ncbi:hypothetical protein B2D07_03245 [Desulfococcus multivorans]|nr:hypothetical protein B2D07_03245 [Desulfococcus multivorans]
MSNGHDPPTRKLPGNGQRGAAAAGDLPGGTGPRPHGQPLRFFVRGTEVYAVDEDFPRLPDDLFPPSGIVSVK